MDDSSSMFKVDHCLFILGLLGPGGNCLLLVQRKIKMEKTTLLKYISGPALSTQTAQLSGRQLLWSGSLLRKETRGTRRPPHDTAEQTRPSQAAASFLLKTVGIKSGFIQTLCPTFRCRERPWPSLTKSNIIASRYPSALNVVEMYLLNVEKEIPPLAAPRHPR